MKIDPISGAMSVNSENTMPQSKEETTETINFQYTKQEPTDVVSGKLKRPKPPVKPVKPVKPNIENNLLEYTVQEGDNLSTLAERYHVKVSQVKELNSLKSEDYIRPGQKLKIPYVDDKKWAAYEKALKKYDGYYDPVKNQWITGDKEKYDEALEIFNRTLESIEKVEYIMCSTNVFDKGITLSVDYKTGNIIIKADREGLKLKDIKRALFLKDGVLLAQNPTIKKKYTPKIGLGFKINEGLRREAKWDKTELKLGDTLVMDPDYVHYNFWEKISSEY